MLTSAWLSTVGTVALGELKRTCSTLALGWQLCSGRQVHPALSSGLSTGACVCRTRMTVLFASHVEGGVMSMPVARNKLKVVKRETHAVCGEVTTVFGSYTGVEYRPKPEAPRISSIEKDKIFKQTGRKPLPDAWTEDYGASEPLFWQETKPIGMWRALIQDFQVKSIFDVTAGSGALAEAAMMEGAVYHGLCAAPRDSV